MPECHIASVAERLGKTGLLSTQLGKLPSPDTVSSILLLQESQTSSLSEPLLGILMLSS